MSAPPSRPPAIIVESLLKCYDGKIVVDQLNFSVAAGETFAFLGPNGAGKTTTIKMLTTLLPPDKGRILLNGVDLAKDPMGARRHFGVVFQDCTLDKTMTVHENLWMHCVLHQIPRAERRARIGDVLALFDVSDRRDSMVDALSGGLRRRIEIARALLHRPALVFLDEPTLGLDPKSRRILWAHLQHLQSKYGTTIFLTSHYLDEVERFAHNVAVIKKGRIIIQGSVDAIIRHSEKTTLEDSFLFLTAEEQAEEDLSAVAGA
ncbi:ATP-binding cassette domain-containing protein [Gluconobacter sp. R71646]|uniref:ATP-binding cassette domain-containing protein n=1 Tax=Gluconobacter potus TaxID=2724927 RepID=A0ABR9YM80_9PROT|nr:MULTISPECIES: ATP-binding cassette domain-containing protein [Gluconobacter]MBF0864367.1 ATP-binding cassette domain-containing protein [Gluconobacter sp. R71656]MBF0867239.1 ATP-binding cassette domain-containing protein [Gluconobacter sp. R75628]MBF0873669.1 ATP-binding cassette domain-containing protein [Gluconobacter sp. R75629]MBF0882915.1 ATP-binding cassette domain-containing protein [Gluconobacter potus]